MVSLMVPFAERVQGTAISFWLQLSLCQGKMPESMKGEELSQGDALIKIVKLSEQLNEPPD